MANHKKCYNCGFTLAEHLGNDQCPFIGTDKPYFYKTLLMQEEYPFPDNQIDVAADGTVIPIPVKDSYMYAAKSNKTKPWKEKPNFGLGQTKELSPAAELGNEVLKEEPFSKWKEFCVSMNAQKEMAIQGFYGDLNQMTAQVQSERADHLEREKLSHAARRFMRGPMLSTDFVEILAQFAYELKAGLTAKQKIEELEQANRKLNDIKHMQQMALDKLRLQVKALEEELKNTVPKPKTVAVLVEQNGRKFLDTDP